MVHVYAQPSYKKLSASTMFTRGHGRADNTSKDDLNLMAHVHSQSLIDFFSESESYPINLAGLNFFLQWELSGWWEGFIRLRRFTIRGAHFISLKGVFYLDI